ncbi:ABC transporter permease subunit [Sphaerimonospora cavernae]|uniref:ABC transporter permease subunit n=1 Tax=Sphaerimonospora cavernae TaxID=1740611 RepID=A0ABV6U923_9ACTN
MLTPSGSGRLRIVRRHFLPHLAPHVALAAVLMMPHAIWHETALSFLGLGLPPHLASLGNMINDGSRSLLAGNWWASLVPGLSGWRPAEPSPWTWSGHRKTSWPAGCAAA